MSYSMDDRNVVSSPVCSYCLHKITARRCKAFPFPNSIPLEIWCGDDPHTSPRMDDNGYQFLQNPKLPAPLLGDDNLDLGDLQP